MVGQKNDGDHIYWSELKCGEKRGNLLPVLLYFLFMKKRWKKQYAFCQLVEWKMFLKSQALGPQSKLRADIFSFLGFIHNPDFLSVIFSKQTHTILYVCGVLGLVSDALYCESSDVLSPPNVKMVIARSIGGDGNIVIFCSFFTLHSYPFFSLLYAY